MSTHPAPSLTSPAGAASCALQRAGLAAGSGREAAGPREADFLRGGPGRSLDSQISLGRARSLPQPATLNPPTYFLRSRARSYTHTHTHSELPKISNLRPPPELTSFQRFLSWTILGFVRQEKRDGARAGEETGCLLFAVPQRSEERTRA